MTKFLTNMASTSQFGLGFAKKTLNRSVDMRQHCNSMNSIVINHVYLLSHWIQVTVPLGYFLFVLVCFFFQLVAIDWFTGCDLWNILILITCCIW